MFYSWEFSICLLAILKDPPACFAQFIEESSAKVTLCEMLKSPKGYEEILGIDKTFGDPTQIATTD